MSRREVGQGIGLQRVELGKPDDCNVGQFGLGPDPGEIVIDLPGAENEPPGSARCDPVLQNRLETARREDIDRREGLLGAKQRFGSEDDQGFPRAEQSLTPQQVKVLPGGARDHHSHVLIGAQLEEPFDSGRGVLGSLTFISMGQEQGQTRLLTPFGLAGGDELVDDDLGAVAEVTELRLPGDEGLVPLDRVAVFESDRGELGQWRVDHPDPASPRR